MKGSNVPNHTSLKRLRYFGLLFICGLLLSACLLAAEKVTPEQRLSQANAAILAEEQRLISFRYDLHRHPELSLQEKRTSKKIAEYLEQLGFEVRTKVGGYGVVGILRGTAPGASSGPTVAFRADIDASRGYLDDPAEYASTVPGVVHNCGHDVHAAIGMGLAVGFAEIRDTLPGNVVLVFQPAEETGTGARAMLADNVFADLQPDAILAVHTFPIEVGQFASRGGAMIAGRARLAVTLSGPGDLSEATKQVRSALNEVSTVSAAAILEPASEDFIYVELEPSRVRSAEGERKKSVIRGLVMSAGQDRRADVQKQVMDAIDRLSLDGVDVEVYYQQALEGVNNDAEILAITSRAIGALNPENRLQTPPIFPAFSEDFGSFQQEVPGVMYLIGVNNSAKGTVGFPHSRNFVADDRAITIGAKAMLAASLALMENK